MTEELDTSKEAQAEGQEGQEKTQDPPVEQDKGKGKPFTPDQEQYIGSWMGRIIKKQFDESVMPVLQDAINRKPTFHPGGDNEVLKKFNEELSEEMFTNPLGAIQKAVNAIEQSKVELTKTQTVQVDKAITSHSDDPLYKDIYQDMRAIAHDAVKKGYPPGPAAEYALAKAKANHFENATKGEGGLNFADGGKSTAGKKTPKLPPEFKKAAARDIEKGLFKNEAEYIESLSPAIRAKYGI